MPHLQYLLLCQYYILQVKDFFGSTGLRARRLIGRVNESFGFSREAIEIYTEILEQKPDDVVRRGHTNAFHCLRRLASNAFFVSV